MAGANRLQLDFSLSTNQERVEFLNQYLQRPEFIKRPPTEEELETMGNYLLWGKDPITGLNSKQSGLVDIETKHGTWDKNSNTESLEGLMESPTFNENQLQPVDTTPFKIKREVFSRQEALDKCPEYLRETMLVLFHQIDVLDLTINFYELQHGRRKNPPREQLMNKFTEEEQEKMRERVSHWNQYHYLKMRHELVEMRREQYTLRDSFAPTILSEASTNAPTFFSDPQFDCEIAVLPLGTKNQSELRGYIFRKWEELIPANFTPEMLDELSKYYWEKKNYNPNSNQFYLDFRDLEHVYGIFKLFFELDGAASCAELESNLPALMETLQFYVDQAELTELQKEILDLKLRKVKNTDIAQIINEKWHKTYTSNYISTIFRQRIIPKINEAAAYHEKIVGNLFFEEEFKTCTKCGRTLLLDSYNFTHKTRSKDGFTSRCKKCEKQIRMGQNN